MTSRITGIVQIRRRMMNFVIEPPCPSARAGDPERAGRWRPARAAAATSPSSLAIDDLGQVDLVEQVEVERVLDRSAAPGWMYVYQ